MPTRARNLEELDALMQASFSAESVNKGLAFRAKPSDVIIAPFTKCGTTWLQQIVHGLRTRGSMDFREISLVTPWIETAADLGIELNAEQVAQPRVYKSHAAYYDVPKGARYIVSFRHYENAFISTFRFFNGFFIDRGSIGMEEFFNWRFPKERLEETGYWYHLRSWLEQGENENVLLLCYENMLQDPHKAVRRIAEFLDIELDKELFNIVVRQSSREFMLEHKDKFSENFFLEHLIEKGVLPHGGNADKVTKGNEREEKLVLKKDLAEKLDGYWKVLIGRNFGLKSYEELCLKLDRINDKRFLA